MHAGGTGSALLQRNRDIDWLGERELIFPHASSTISISGKRSHKKGMMPVLNNIVQSQGISRSSEIGLKIRTGILT